MACLSWILSNIALAALLASIACFVQRRLKWHSVARILWVIVLIKLVTPPLVSVPLGNAPASVACSLGVCGCGKHAQSHSLWRGALPWGLLAVWTAGASATGWTAWRRWTRFRRLMSHASPAPLAWRSQAAQLAVELKIRRPPEILSMPGRLPPLVVPGWRRPRMLLPTTLLVRLNDSQRVTLLLHELVHIRRGDHLVRMLELAVGVVYWWLPIVGPIGKRLRACEERCCDGAVVARLPHQRRDYAQLLLDVVEFANPLPREAIAQASSMSAVDDLEQRLIAILDAASGARNTRPAGMLAIVVACAIVPCQLRYDTLLRRPAPSVSAAKAPEVEPAPGATPATSDERQVEIPDAFCCPT